MAALLPSNWRAVTLKEVAANKKNAIVDGPFGSNLKTDDYVESGVPVLQGKNITNDAFRWFDVRYITEKKADELKRSSVRVDDLLVVKIGSIGYSAIVDSLNGFEFAIIPANLVKVTPNPEVISTKYLHRWLTSPAAKRYLVANASKTAQPALSLGKIKELPVPLPPLPEQTRIAAIFDQADALRVKRRVALAQLDNLTQSIFIDMFGDPGTNPKQWPIQPLSALIKGKPNNGIFKKNDEYGEGLPVVWVGELFKDNGINCSNSQRLVPSEREVEQYGLHHGDVLFCRSSLKLAGIGYNNVYLGESNKALFECHVIRITPDKDKLDPMFLNFALRMPSQRLKLFKHAKTVTMTTIDQDGLLRVDLPVPPLQLQKQFADKLNAIERLKALHAIAQVELDTLFNSLQHRAFRGEL